MMDSDVTGAVAWALLFVASFSAAYLAVRRALRWRRLARWRSEDAAEHARWVLRARRDAARREAVARRRGQEAAARADRAWPADGM